MQRAILYGEEHVELGPIATHAVGDRVGLAITRGRWPKAYKYTDPNEDVVAAVAGPRATLLVCADGHNGGLASRVAVEAVLVALGADPPPRFDDAQWLELFADVNAQVMDAAAASHTPASRTVLLVALVADGSVSWGSLGDAALVLAHPGGAGRQVNRELARFVGYPMGPQTLSELVQRGEDELEAGEWVVLASDGLSEFVRERPARAVPRALEGAADAEAAALAVVNVACEAGAGDNVAVAVAKPA